MASVTAAAEVALRYAAAGWPVFPCKENTKVPATKHGFEDATTDTGMITLWWTWWPDANVAIATGAPAVDVVDVDRKGAVDGMLALERLTAAGLLDGALGRVRTPSGGVHLYFRGTRQGNGSLRGHGVDFRGLGGYVLAPPSIVDGNPYEVLDWRPGARGMAVDWGACKSLLDPPRPAQARERYQLGDITALARWLTRQAEGNRNHGLYWAACRAVESGHVSDLDILVAAAVQAGLPEREAQKTVNSAARRLGPA